MFCVSLHLTQCSDTDHDVLRQLAHPSESPMFVYILLYIASACTLQLAPNLMLRIKASLYVILHIPDEPPMFLFIVWSCMYSRTSPTSPQCYDTRNCVGISLHLSGEPPKFDKQYGVLWKIVHCRLAPMF